VKPWLKSLAAAGIGGGSTALSSWGALAGAQAMGVDVPVLNLKAFGLVFVVGAVHSVAAYLAKSPLPGVTIEAGPAGKP
jgi:hypothetical protein